MMKGLTFRTLTLLFVMAIVAVSCTPNSTIQMQQQPFDLGTTTAGHYHNNYFALDLYFDSTWSIQQNEPVTFAKEWEENKTDSLLVKHINAAYLLTILKHPLNGQTTYPSKFVAMVENGGNFSQIPTGRDYLLHVQKLLGQTALDYQFGEMQEEKIGERTFVSLELNVKYAETAIQQSYWCTIDKGFFLTFILSYNSKQEQEELVKILKTMKY